MHSVEYAQHIRVWEAESVKKKKKKETTLALDHHRGVYLYYLFHRDLVNARFRGSLLNIFRNKEARYS